ncbi:hypothetical protein FPV67DRAFT_1356536, partial [Lyophyllum atratum]
VEDCLFRVPTHYFNASTDFFTSDFESLGENREDFLKLENVTKTDFRALLNLMYPLPLALTRTLTDDEWASVLKLSTMWKMLDIRRMAINHLTAAPMSLADRIAGLDPIERAVLARKYDVAEWLRAAFFELVRRPERVSVDEARTLGLETAIGLCGTRELHALQ